MRSLNWKDLHLTPNEYVEMFAELLKKSEFFTDMESSWHPEDLSANAEVVFETMNDTLVLYMDVLRNKMLSPAHSSGAANATNSEPKTGNPDRIQVFGGTVPKGYAEAYPTYTGNTFGDNV